MQLVIKSLILGVFMLCFLPNTNFAIVAINHFQNSPTSTVDKKNELSKESLEKALGRKLTFKEKVLFLITKKIRPNSSDKNTKYQKHKSRGGKSQIVALVLCLFLGLLGIHRFYLGYTGTGILFLLTLGIFGIGWLIDLILLIIPNGLSPKGRTSYKE